jgi:hypothetical protein
MSLRTLKMNSHLEPEEAYTLIEFLDQMRELLMQTYGEDIRVMLRQARLPREPIDWPGDEDPF